MEPPAAPAAAGIKRRRARGTPCVACRRIRMRCDGNLPCGRCSRKGIDCIPQQRAAKDARKQAPAAATAAAAAAEAASTAISALSLQQAGLVQLALLKSDPRPVAQLMLRCFLRQARAPGARRAAVLDMMRQWYLRGVACGADASWGVLGVAMRELQVAQTDLEGPQWIALDAAVQQRRLELMAGLQTAAANGATLLRQTFGPAAWIDDGQTGYTVNMPSSHCHGLHQIVANGTFQQRFYESMELHDTFVHKRTTHLLLSSLLVVPEDREAFFDAFFQVILSATPRRVVHFGKGYDRHGRIQLWIAEARSARVDPDGTPHGIAFRFTPCPASRHLTPDAGAPRSRVDAFRAPDGKAAATSAAAAAAATTAASSGPSSFSPAAAAAVAAGAAAPMAPLPARSWLAQVQGQEHAHATALAAAVAAGPASGGLAALPLPTPALLPPASPVFISAPAALPAAAGGVAQRPVAGAAGWGLTGKPAPVPAAAAELGGGAVALPLLAEAGPPELTDAILEELFSDDDEIMETGAHGGVVALPSWEQMGGMAARR